MSPTAFSASSARSRAPVEIGAILCTLILITWTVPGAQAQSPSMLPLGLPNFNVGPDAGFARIDFAQSYLDEQSKRDRDSESKHAKDQALVTDGVVSALDLAAPNKAVQEFNRATTLLKAQNSKEASKHLENALRAYPKFVSAHNALGLAYLDLGDARAQNEFETAAKLDEKFPGSFLNLGLLDLSKQDYAAADANLLKAASLSPQNPRILLPLALAQNGDRQYEQVLNTAQRAHSLDHRGMANVHYIAASAAATLKDFDTVQRELTLFIKEDPTNPLAPVARQNLEVLARRQQPPTLTAAKADSPVLHTFPNSERLKAQLQTVDDGYALAHCETCIAPGAANVNEISGEPVSSASAVPSNPASPWMIRKAVDETALFFAVSSHGHMISDLKLSDFQLRDDNDAPERVLQFIPQSKLPLRLGLLIDTSGSLQRRFSFEKRAAAKFLEKVLNGTSDLAFVGAFNSEITVTQDFTAKPDELAKGIEPLKIAGGTALFDAVSFACWKLRAYPDQQRVARVLVVLSDGEDNSSHRSLKQAIEDAENSDVTIYTLSTREDAGLKTDADQILSVLAERSGGEAMFPGDMLTLGGSLDKLRDLIRSRYLIAYKPAHFEPNGKYRSIQIVAEKEGKHLQVHARKGYFARLQANPQ